MRTLSQLLVIAMLLALGVGTVAGQTKLEEQRVKAEQGDLSMQSLLGHRHYQGWGVPIDYAEAAKWFRLAAEHGEQGDLAKGPLFSTDRTIFRAQWVLGTMYESGEEVQQDYAEALKWYRVAAEQGDANAQFNLGFMYNNG